jgi:senataxin
VDILKCFLFLLKRLGSNIWQGEGPEYPLVVFDAVKDNTSYSQLVQSIDPKGDRPWFLAWFPEFLHTLRDLPVYGDILAKMIDFMCEELQHERFHDARPTVMISSTRVSSFLSLTVAAMLISNYLVALIVSHPQRSKRNLLSENCRG